MKQIILLSAFVLLGSAAIAQTKTPLPPLPAPQSVPKPAAGTGQPYAPGAILPGGIVVPLFAPYSPYLNADKIHKPEVYNMSQTVHGRISSIVSIHNPSIEVHMVEKSINTGTAVIVIAGGGHRTLNVGGESADFVPFFYNYGINTIILRNRLRADGYVAEVDAVHDAQQAVRVVRAYAKEWGIDPKRIGVMGFSAGAELAAPAAVLYESWDKKNNDPSDPFAGISSRPDFAGIIYPGPTPFARNRTAPPIPKDVPPAFLVCGSAGDRAHAIWALEYYQAMLSSGVPNVEIHLYGNGRHPGDAMPDGTRMSGGLSDRNNIPYGTWQYRFIDWVRDLGFLQKSGIETKAAKDVAGYVASPPRPFGQGRGGAARDGQSLAGGAPLLGSTLSAQSLDLPPRQPTAPKGRAFALSIAALPLEEREEKILAEVKAGNVPPFLRKLVPVAVSAGTVKASYFVAPDYLAIGSDDDFFLTPLTPLAAQAIADRLDCVLPTPKMVDNIYRSATVKLEPVPVPPSPAMTSVAVFLRHNEIVRAARGETPPGTLVAGHKKDVVIAKGVFTARGKVAIYGWHKPDGKPIQPLYVGHAASHVDYSHGIRLVSRRMMVDGVAKTIEEVLADPERASLLSNEGPMLQTRYRRTDSVPSLRAAPSASSR